MTMELLIFAVFVLVVSQYGQASLPVKIPATAIPSSGQCAPLPDFADAIEALNEVMPSVFPRSPCACDKHGKAWAPVAYLNMNDSSQTCPSAWATINTPVRGCGRQPSNCGSCHSVFYSSNGLSYTQVCGRINGYQYGTPNAFYPSVIRSINLDKWYVDGVSLTHGPPGSRTHVWTFANAYSETTTVLTWKCACMLSNPSEWPYAVPSFVGNDYFCATGSRDIPSNTVLSNNLLWDGVGCTGSNTCCQFNQPPWFCRTLPAATSDDLEVRICADESTSNENTYISNIELYVR